MKPTIVIPGGTGFLGQAIANSVHREKYRFVILTRSMNAFQSSHNIRYMQWDGKTQGVWNIEVDGAYAVINLAGKSVNCRYNEANKRKILHSRLDSTNAIARAIQCASNPPKVWINSSSATIYEHSEDRLQTESEGVLGKDFSPEVCKRWEAVVNQAQTPFTRKIIARTSMVMGNSGGVLPVLKRLVRFGLGGKQGNGQQYVSWIHIDDFIRIMDVFLHTPKEGAYNVTAPVPIKNVDFLKTLRNALKIPIGFPATKWMLEVGAILLGTETELLLKSRNVFPKKLIEEGFKFQYTTFQAASKQLFTGRKENRMKPKNSKPLELETA